jgi:hypothetical protein
MTVTMANGAKPLSKQERQRMPRPRKDGASVARELAQLADKYGVSSTMNVAGMLNAVDLAEQLLPLDKAVANFSVLVHDRFFTAQASAWKTATTVYTVLQRMAKDDPDLARDLQGVAASFKNAPSVPDATGTTTETTAKTPDSPPATTSTSSSTQSSTPAK